MKYRLSQCLRILLLLASGVAAPVTGAAPPAAVDDSGLPALTAAEQVQNAVSASLTRASVAQRERQKPSMDRVIADIQRTLHLPENRVALLRIAVAGMLQRYQEPSARGALAEAERRTKGVSPKVVGKVLASIGSFGGSSPSLRPSRNSFWQDLLKQLLTAEELEKWQAVVQGRLAYRAAALADFIMSRVSAVLLLSQEQADKLKPLLETSIVEYLPDATTTWMNDDEEQGLYSGYVQVFILGVPEKDAKAVVKPDQWEKWNQAAGEYSGEWEWIKRMHDDRVKEAKAQ